MSKIAQLIPIRQLLSALAALGLGWTAFDAWSDVMTSPALAPYTQHQKWIIVQIFCILTGAAALSALTPGQRISGTPASLPALRKLAAHLRSALFIITVLLLEAALISTFCTLIWFSFVDGTPTIQWGRVGGVFTDWVIDLALVLPLLLGLAVINLFQLVPGSKK